MDTVLDVALSLAALFVVGWVVVFGGVGALLSHGRGGSAAIGFVWGALLGPFGWIGIWWTTRDLQAATSASEKSWSELGAELEDDTW